MKITMKQIVLATTNQGKQQEFARLLQGLDIEVLSLKEFPEIGEIIENGETFEENALIKARTVANYTGLCALADDSGLIVDYLDGAPGIYSARFAGEERCDEKNNQKLLALLENVPKEKRTAKFCCAIAIVSPHDEEQVVTGYCQGMITNEPIGHGGFGYDPLFWVPQYHKTFAQLSIDEKNAISHRGMANRQAVLQLRQMVEGVTGCE